MRLPTSPMLAKPGPLPTGPGWSYEVKWDGFRALVSTVDGLKVRSRRGVMANTQLTRLARAARPPLESSRLVAAGCASE